MIIYRDWYVLCIYFLIIQILILEKQIKLHEFLELFFMVPQCSVTLEVVRLTLTVSAGA